MSTVKTRSSRRASSTESAPPEPPAFSAPSKLARKRPALVALCIALALVGGLVTYFGLSANNQVAVLVAKDGLVRGQEITAANLTSINIASDAGNGAVPIEQSGTVVGQQATVDLPKGSLITKNNVGPNLGIKDGTSVVGVGLTTAQVPSRQLQTGDHVRIIRTPTQGGQIDTKATPVAGVVDSTRADDVKGLIIVDVVVPTDAAAEVVAWSASGNAGLILDPLQNSESGK